MSIRVKDLSIVEKIRILMVLGNSGRGGAQTFAINVLRMIDRNKFQVDFVFNEVLENGYASEIKSFGSRIFLVPFFKIYNWFSYVKAWEEILQTEKYDIVHGHVSSSAVVYLRVARRYGCKTILHSHSAGYRGNCLLRWIKKLFSVNAKRYADYWFACSGLAATRLFGRNYRKNRNYYDMPNAIVVNNYIFDKAIRDSVRQRLGVDNNTKLFCHVGSFTEAKNHTFLIDIFDIISKLDTKSKFVLAGDGPFRNKIEGLISKHSLGDRIQLLGNVPNVNEIMMASDVMVFPSLFEGFPVTVLEAEATGLPSIISDAITKEVKLCDCVEYMSLNYTAVEWALKAVSMASSKNREKFNQVVARTKYNMANSVNLLMRIYNEIGRNIAND